MEQPGVVVACLRWGAGFDVAYCNVLRRAVRDHLSLPHRFVCLTDDAAGLDPEIEPVPLPPVPLPRERWADGVWPKLGLYHPAAFAPGSLVLFLDLDILIAGRLEPFIERVRAQGGLHIIEEWPNLPFRRLPRALRPRRGANSSVIGWIAGEQDHIYARFADDPQGTLARFRREQDAVDAWARARRFWPSAWCVSFKNTCVRLYPLNSVLPPRRPPPSARVVVFHGRPRPLDLMQAPGFRWGSRRRFGTEPVAWVTDYWRRYGGLVPAG